jgi:hypothetical protein
MINPQMDMTLTTIKVMIEKDFLEFYFHFILEIPQLVIDKLVLSLFQL